MTHMRNATRRDVLRTTGAGVAGGLALLPGTVSAQPSTYRAELEPGTDDDARGQARFTLRTDEIRFDLAAQDLDDFESAWLLAGTGDVGTESEVQLDQVGRLSSSDRSLSMSGTITDDDVGGGDPTVADLIENIENGEDPRVWIFVDSDECATVPSGACIPGLGLRGGLFPVGKP